METAPGAEDTKNAPHTEARSREERLRDNPVAATEHRALRLFHRAAELQDAHAMLRIGDYHYYGRAAVPPSAMVAASFYKMSINQHRSPQVPFVIVIAVPSQCDIYTPSSVLVLTGGIVAIAVTVAAAA